MFVTVKEDLFGENYVFEFCGEMYSLMSQGKPRVALASDQTSLYAVPRLDS